MEQDRRVAVVGLGYVGLPLALAFHEAGLEVIGVDEDRARLALLGEARSPVDDVSDDRLRRALAGGLAVLPSVDERTAEADAVFVCVPTPVDSSLEPDLSAVLSAAGALAAVLRRGQLIGLQSTTYPGTTSGPFRQVLERSGLTAGRDFALVYAPERLSPVDAPSVAAPRIVGGVTDADARRAASLLAHLGGQVHVVSSPDVAEMAKLLENVFRNVNVALVNQLALICERMGLDAWEVIAAAATKPFGFMPFWPGPGVGGHCIPVDPYYLSFRARQLGLEAPFVAAAGDINRAMPLHVVDLVDRALATTTGGVRGSAIGVVGVAFKPNVSDVRNSPAADVMSELSARGARVSFHDPHIDRFTDAAGRQYESGLLDELIVATDLVVVLVSHAAVDWPGLYRRAPLVVDTVNSVAAAPLVAGKVLRLGAGWHEP